MVNTVTNGEYIVKYRDVDCYDRMKASAITEIFEELVTENSVMLGIDLNTVRSYGVKWIVSKIRVVLDGSLCYGKKLFISTWPKKPGVVKCERMFKARDEVGREVAKVSSTWCVLSVDGDKILKSSAVKSPADAVYSDENADASAAPRPRPTVGELAFSHKFMYTDIDENRHVNNIVYVRLAENALSVEERKNLRLTGFEADFLAQAFEGESVSVYKETVDGVLYVSERVGEKEVFRGAFAFEKVGE